MRINVFLFLVFISIGLCLWLMPTGTEALPTQRHGFGRCQPCTIYCPCGYLIDRSPCPKCICRPSNTCTGRHPNSFGRPRFVKSNILY